MVTLLLLLTSWLVPATAASPRGYHFLEGVSHTTIPFQLYKNLIVIPAQLNDTLSVNLILDTGTRSLLLYGKRFANLPTLKQGPTIRVSGWGSGSTIEARMAFPNKLSIGEITGHELSIAVVPTRKMFSDRPKIDGIIGYELFVRFVVEINYKTKQIHLYNRVAPGQTLGFTAVPLEVNRARPQVVSTIRLKDNREVNMKLLVDTGSSLGLTIFSRSREGYETSSEKSVIGFGLAGSVLGYQLQIDNLQLGTLLVQRITTNLVQVTQHPDDTFEMAGSLGAEFLKNHIVIFDYPGSRMFLKQNT
jgi:hypothetical protein